MSRKSKSPPAINAPRTMASLNAVRTVTARHWGSDTSSHGHPDQQDSPLLHCSTGCDPSSRRADHLFPASSLGYNHGSLRSSGLDARQEERVMEKDDTICIGTVGQGLWQSPA